MSQQRKAQKAYTEGDDPNAGPRNQSDAPHQQHEDRIAQPPTLADVSISLASHDPIKQESMFAPPQQPGTPAESVRSEHSGGTGKLPKEKSGLQSDHTTPAHKLFEEWPSMANFSRNVDYIEKLIEGGHDVSEYPMLLEQDRSLLRVWGVGEGQDLNDGAQGPGSPDSGGDGDASSPAPGKEGLWGFPPADTPVRELTARPAIQKKMMAVLAQTAGLTSVPLSCGSLSSEEWSQNSASSAAPTSTASTLDHQLPTRFIALKRKYES
ncbi:hypothetical protein E8E11_001033 [Didymella keratinophila]|nr:hypothetical protein E8E11_001033 [Didymella keratinophila]